MIYVRCDCPLFARLAYYYFIIIQFVTSFVCILRTKQTSTSLMYPMTFFLFFFFTHTRKIFAYDMVAMNIEHSLSN